MNLKNIIAVSGLPGLLELVSSKSNGLILLDPITRKSKFFSVRMHQFTPLETIGIYTMTDTIELKEVFKKMMSIDPEGLGSKSQNIELMAYMGKLIPDYDPDKVHPADVKKLIKWYNFSKELGYLDREEDNEIVEKEGELETIIEVNK